MCKHRLAGTFYKYSHQGHHNVMAHRCHITMPMTWDTVARVFNVSVYDVTVILRAVIVEVPGLSP